LLAFADDMLVMSNCKHEIEQIVSELENLQIHWNLRLNKKKSEILIFEDVKGIGGMRRTTSVKDLGVKVTVDKKE
jgi:hypothetical protein